MNFEEELSKGNFMISRCSKCNSNVWPPNEICNKCFGRVQWKKASDTGHVIEYSQINEKIFCLAEFDQDVRVMGHLLSNTIPKIGQKIKLRRCSLKNGNYNFEMVLCQNN